MSVTAMKNVAGSAESYYTQTKPSERSREFMNKNKLF